MLRRLIGISAVFAFLAVSTVAEAQNGTLFRIGTGGIGGTYYPVGQTIAGIIGNPPGSRPCNEGGTCGVQGMTAVALTSLGSVANVAGIVKAVWKPVSCSPMWPFGRIAELAFLKERRR